MILNNVTPAEWQNSLNAENNDWRLAVGALLLAWCRVQDQEKPITTIKKWGVISFTIRVKHLTQLVPVLFGKALAGGGNAEVSPADQLLA